MKKIILPLIGSMLISVCTVQAQQEEPAGTASKSRSKTKQQQQTQHERDQNGQSQTDRNQSWQQQSDRTQGNDAYANQGMVIIEKEQIPESLKKTLKDEKYAGWENATIYHNTNTGEYVIAPRAYRFDDDGKEIELTDADRNAYGQGRTGRYSNGDRNRDYSDRTRSGMGDQRQNNDQQRNNDGTTTSDQSGNQSTDQTSRDQSYNSQSQDQSDKSSTGDQQKPSSGYRSGQDTQTDGAAQDDDDTRNSSDTQNGTSTQSPSGQNSQDQ